MPRTAVWVIVRDMTNLWPWMRNLGEARNIVEVVKEACVKSKFGDDYPLSRVRHYDGSRCIDWMYVCLMLLRIFQPMHVFTREVQLHKKKFRTQFSLPCTFILG